MTAKHCKTEKNNGDRGLVASIKIIGHKYFCQGKHVTVHCEKEGLCRIETCLIGCYKLEEKGIWSLYCARLQRSGHIHQYQLSFRRVKNPPTLFPKASPMLEFSFSFSFAVGPPYGATDRWKILQIACRKLCWEGAIQDGGRIGNRGKPCK